MFAFAIANYSNHRMMDVSENSVLLQITLKESITVTAAEFLRSPVQLLSICLSYYIEDFLNALRFRLGM